jgi:hypothetical protein
VVFPLLIALAQSSTRNAATAGALAFLVDVEHSRGSSAIVDRFLKGCESFIACRKETLQKFMVAPSASYGGAVSRRRAHSDDAQRHRIVRFDEDE